MAGHGEVSCQKRKKPYLKVTKKKKMQLSDFKKVLYAKKAPTFFYISLKFL